MEPIDYFKLQAKNLLKDYKTRFFNEEEGFYDYKPKYFDVSEIFWGFKIMRITKNVSSMKTNHCSHTFYCFSRITFSNFNG